MTNRQLEKEQLQRHRRRAKETKMAKKIVRVIALISLCALLIVGFTIWSYVQHNLQPVDKQDTTKIEVTVRSGATYKSLGQQLEQMGIIRSATLFNFYTKTKDVGLLQSGNYALSKSMTLDEIMAVLKEGGTTEKAILATVLVREGDQITQIAKAVAKTTPITEEAFLEAVQNETVINQLVERYPELLGSMSQATQLKYQLEGYLFPATYDYHENDTAETLVNRMIAKSEDVMKKYYGAIKEKGLNVHQVLTIASLAEKEGVKTEDRRFIVSVFNNRLAINMPLQSDISILYALGVHKELVTYADLEVDSPYNLYKNVGYGPGPFNSPGEDAIASTLNPESSDYLYFVADTKTGTVYYSKTLEEHNALVEKYVNN